MVMSCLRRPRALTRIGAAALVLVSAAMIGLAPRPAASRELTAPEKTSLAQTVEHFKDAMRDRESETLVNAVPPRIIASIAETSHVQADALHKSMVAQIGKIMASGVITAYGMSLDEAKYESLTDGTPYVLIPTDTTLTVGGHKIEKHANTLAFMDEGTWYLVEVGKPAQIARLVTVYPHFAGVDFGGESSKDVP